MVLLNLLYTHDTKLRLSHRDLRPAFSRTDALALAGVEWEPLVIVSAARFVVQEVAGRRFIRECAWYACTRALLYTIYNLPRADV